MIPQLSPVWRRKAMQRSLILLAIGACVSGAFINQPASAQTAPEVTLTRLECGTPNATPTDMNLRFSDTYSYNNLKLSLIYSCYLIKHGGDYMVWDAGHAMTAPNVAPKESIVQQLAKLNINP